MNTVIPLVHKHKPLALLTTEIADIGRHTSPLGKAKRARALTRLGLQHLETDMYKGLRMLERAHINGDITALRHMGMFFLEAHTLYRDIPRGLEYLERAMQEGDLEATACLAQQYKSGRHIKHNHRLARKLYKAAAAQRHPAACFEMGRIEEARSQHHKAVEYYAIAAQQLHPGATEAIRRIARKL